MPDIKTLLGDLANTASNTLTPGLTLGVPDVIKTVTPLTSEQIAAIASGKAQPVSTTQTTSK